MDINITNQTFIIYACADYVNIQVIFKLLFLSLLFCHISAPPIPLSSYFNRIIYTYVQIQLSSPLTSALITP